MISKSTSTLTRKREHVRRMGRILKNDSGQKSRSRWALTGRQVLRRLLSRVHSSQASASQRPFLLPQSCGSPPEPLPAPCSPSRHSVTLGPGTHVYLLIFSPAPVPRPREGTVFFCHLFLSAPHRTWYTGCIQLIFLESKRKRCWRE